MNSLELWVEVPDGPRYKGIKIDKIAFIDYSRFQDDSVYPEEADPFKVEFRHALPEDDDYISFVYTGLIIRNPKKFITRLPILNHISNGILSIGRAGMYYVYIKTKGIPDPDIPCCCFKELTVGCCINHFPIYNLMLKTINAYDDKCMIAEDKILDLYLKKKLLEQAVETSDYIMANKIFREVYQREIDRGFCYDACGSFKLRPYAGRIHDISTRSGCVTCG